MDKWYLSEGGLRGQQNGQQLCQGRARKIFIRDNSSKLRDLCFAVVIISIVSNTNASDLPGIARESVVVDSRLCTILQDKAHHAGQLFHHSCETARFNYGA